MTNYVCKQLLNFILENTHVNVMKEGRDTNRRNDA